MPSTILYLNPTADLPLLERRLKGMGQWSSRLKNEQGAVNALSLNDPAPKISTQVLKDLPGVLDVFAPSNSHPLVDAQRGRVVSVRGLKIGAGAPPVLIAGPCSVESPEQINLTAQAVAQAGGHLLRGGAFKPRTSPYSFRGHGREALVWMRHAADRNGLAVVTELLSEADAGAVATLADLVQIGARNMQNYALLKVVGQMGLPVLLKRGLSATINEWLCAGEHLLHAGAPGVIFCERGLRSFDGSTRNLLDLGAVALLRHTYNLPVIVDPSHAAGRRDLIGPLSAAAIAVGASGLMVEAHFDPSQALSDAPQALPPTQLNALVSSLPSPLSPRLTSPTHLKVIQ